MLSNEFVFVFCLKLLSFEIAYIIHNLIKPLQQRRVSVKTNKEAVFSSKISILFGWLGSEMYNLCSNTHGYPQKLKSKTLFQS